MSRHRMRCLLIAVSDQIATLLLLPQFLDVVSIKFKEFGIGPEKLEIAIAPAVRRHCKVMIVGTIKLAVATNSMNDK